MAEYRLNIVCTEHGRKSVAEDNMEALTEAFVSTHPDAAAIVAANFHLGTLDATFSVDADDAESAGSIGLQIFADTASHSGLEPIEIVGIKVQSVNVPEAVVR